MTRDVLQEQILTILVQDFEFQQPGLDDNLRDDHGFDSIDAIELLGKIERILGLLLDPRGEGKGDGDQNDQRYPRLPGEDTAGPRPVGCHGMSR